MKPNTKKTPDTVADGDCATATCYALIGTYQEHGYDSEKEFNGVYSTKEKAEFQGGGNDGCILLCFLRDQRM